MHVAEQVINLNAHKNSMQSRIIWILGLESFKEHSLLFSALELQLSLNNCFYSFTASS